MCFNLGHGTKLRKHLSKKRSSSGTSSDHHGEDESKGLLLKEIERWNIQKQQQEMMISDQDQDQEHKLAISTSAKLIHRD
ncbi:hypothetical protein ACJRO7_033370 [Eucalyptus globulus]|uniref:Uncharacterized protein n=1 Tax=Eucalyptus globulus TaxID=34317 RepID=A0ABD3JLW9_EUCGL